MTKSVTAKSHTYTTWRNGARVPIPVPAGPLTLNTWYDRTPPEELETTAGYSGGGGLALAYYTPGTAYRGAGPIGGEGGGLYKTTNYGVDWTNVSGSDFNSPVQTAVDPRNHNRIWSACGVGGVGLGPWRSLNAGSTWAQPPGFATAMAAAGITGTGAVDMYDVAIAPDDSNYILYTFHTDWGAGYDNCSWVVRSRDGGETWDVIPPPDPDVGSGQSINFIGSSNRWIVGTQDNGSWLTDDDGETFTQVTTVNISHGGCRLYTAPNGHLYIASVDTLKSTDNGDSWSVILNESTWAIIGIVLPTIGLRLYTSVCFGGGPIQISDDGGATWSALDAESYEQGAFDSDIDACGNIWFSMTKDGVRLMKVVA